MQMRNTFEPTSKLTRIANHKTQATVCSKAGFPDFAAIHTEMAHLLQSELDYAAKMLLKAASDNAD